MQMNWEDKELIPHPMYLLHSHSLHKKQLYPEHSLYISHNNYDK
jgi:hypothetical protein